MTKEMKQKKDKLDQALADLPGLQASDALVQKVMRDAEARLRPRMTSILWPFGRIWQPAMVMTMALALGVWVGFSMTTIEPEDITDEIESMIAG